MAFPIALFGLVSLYISFFNQDAFHLLATKLQFGCVVRENRLKRTGGRISRTIPVYKTYAQAISLDVRSFEPEETIQLSNEKEELLGSN